MTDALVARAGTAERTPFDDPDTRIVLEGRELAALAGRQLLGLFDDDDLE